MMDDPEHIDPFAFSLRAAGRLFRPSAESAVRKAAARGELRTVALGRRIFTTREWIAEWLSRGELSK